MRAPSEEQVDAKLKIFHLRVLLVNEENEELEFLRLEQLVNARISIKNCLVSKICAKIP